MRQGRRARATAITRWRQGSCVAIPTYRGSIHLARAGCSQFGSGYMQCWCLQPARDERSSLLWLRIAIGIRRTVAAFKPHLVRPVRRRPVHEEFRIEADPAFRIGVELDHPSLDAVGIELWIDRAVQRIGEIDPSSVAADLH